jgi:hypothetical protein
MFIQNCFPMPTCKNTLRGGRSIAMMILSRSIRNLSLAPSLCQIRPPKPVVANLEEPPMRCFICVPAGELGSWYLKIQRERG